MTAAAAAQRLGEVRAWWHVARPPKPLATRLEAFYVVALGAGTIGLLLYGTASSALAAWITPSTLAEWGPSVVLLALLVAARWGSWQGPVVFARPDVAFLLGGPLPRAGLVTPRLRWALIRGALAGAAVGAFVLVGLSGRGRSVELGSAIGLLAGLALCGVLAIPLAWAVQCSARVSRRLGQAAPALVLIAAGMVALARSGPTGRDVVLWSGPWGWAVQPVAGVARGRWLAGLVLLALATVAACVLALRRAAACATERHALRADARDGASASLRALDVRSAQLAMRGVESRPGRRRRSGVRVPQHAALAVPWRDLSATLRVPGRLAEAAVLGGAGSALALTHADHFPSAMIAALLTYLAVARLLEPLRLEVDVPATTRTLLVRPYGRVLVAHIAVALGWVGLVTAVVAVPCALAGSIVVRPGALVVVALASLPTIALCAALSARRGGRMPLEVLLFASSGPDPSGGGVVVLLWLVAWPAGAALIAGGATHLATTAHGVTSAVLLAVIAPFTLASVLRGSQPG
jgi:hypothetical protein